MNHRKTRSTPSLFAVNYLLALQQQIASLRHTLVFVAKKSKNAR